MSTFAERFVEKGRQEGRKEGRKEGRQEGEAQMLLRLLRLKFGVLPEEVQRRIESAEADALLALSERVLTANSIDEVFH